MKQVAKNLYPFSYYLLLLFLPTQFGKHFWPDFTTVLGFRIDYLSPTIYVTDVLLCFLFLIFLWNKKTLFQAVVFSWVKRPQAVLLVTFFVCLIIATIFSINPQEAIYGNIKFYEMMLFALITAHFFTHEKRLKVFIILGVSVLFESLLAIAQFIHQGTFGGIFYFFGERFITPQTPGAANVSLHGQLLLRPYGTFSHPNVLAGYLVVTTTLLLYSVAKTTNKFHRWFISMCLGLGTIAITLSLSRTAILVWALVLISFCYSLVKQKQNKKTLLAGALVVITIAVFGFLLRYRFQTLTLTDESVVLRTQLLQASLLMIKEHLLFGVGLNNFLPQLPSYVHPIKLSLIQPVHNIILLFTAQTGISGLLFAIYFFSSRIRTTTLSKKNSMLSKTAVFTALTVILLLGQTDHYFLTLQQGQLLFAFIIGLLLSFTW